MPIRIVIYGRYRCTVAAADNRQQPEGAEHRDESDRHRCGGRHRSTQRGNRTAVPSPRTTSARYAGSIAKPHGLSAATNPAPKAKPIRSWSTVRGDLGSQGRYPIGQLLPRHRRRRIVHER